MRREAGDEGMDGQPRVGEVVSGDGGLEVRDLLDPERPRVSLRETRAPGDVVVVSREDGGRGGRLHERLAAAGSLRAELYRLVARHGLDPLYPPAAHAEATVRAQQPGIDETGLTDLERLPFVTIDNESSRDLDQALFIDRGEDGYVVWYALADASYYAPPGSALFAEALTRGASYYLPGLTLPMLPRLLSENLVSLNPERSRRSLVFEMRLDGSGQCLATRLHRARIRSRRKLSYERVQRAWDDPRNAFRGEPFEESLELLRCVGELRIDDARRRHVVQHHRSEVEVVPTDAGFAAVTRKRFEVERCNEQISLLCNVEGARLLESGRGLAHVQPVFRVHPAPTPDRLEAFEARVRALVQAHELDPGAWAWRGAEEPLSDYVERLPRSSRPRLAEAIDRLAVLTNRRSSFGELPGRHHGIGAPVYARFSSPMREVVGIFTHKEALELLAGPEASHPTAQDEALRDLVVETANRAKSLQRTLTKESHRLVMERLLRRELSRPESARPWRPGTLLGMKPSHLYVRLDDPPLEVKVHFRDLEKLAGVRWTTDRLRVLASPATGSRQHPLRAGDAVELRLAGHVEKHRRWTFGLRRQ
jgi:ribonuclease R